MAHATLEKFGYPNTVIKEYEHWCVVLRPKQATLGALVLIAKSESTAFSELPPAAFAELQSATKAIETTLKAQFSYDKINYLMLMMVDPQVHFHVLPRYETVKEFEGVQCHDPGWPGPPDLGAAIAFDDSQFQSLLKTLRDNWPG